MDNFSVIKIAASVIFLLGCCLGVYRLLEDKYFNTSYLSEKTSTHGIAKYILPDGTIVWLKGKSTLYHPSVFTGDERAVTLVGEALFEVSKDPAHPFIIRCDSLVTQVVGTSFNIKTEPLLHHIEVVVLTGKVTLSANSGKEKTVLTPHQKAFFNTDTHTLSKFAETQVEPYQVGTDYNMQFEDAPVAEVVDRIAEKFDVKIRMDKKAGNKCLVSADLTDQSLQTALKLITQSLGGDFKQDGESILLTIPECL